MKILSSLALAGLLAASLPAFAQTTPAPQPAPQAAPAREPDPDPAILKAMKSRIFEIKHRNPFSLVQTLQVLGSGVRGARFYSTDREGLNTISVRDFPDNLTAIEEALKRLDVPSTGPKVQDVELHVQVLFASKQPAVEGSVPEELQPVIKALKGALAYRGYTLAATFVQRWDLSSNFMIQGRGLVDGANLGFGTTKDPLLLRIEWEATQAFGNAPKLTGSSLQIPKFQLILEERNGSGNQAKIETSVNLKEGEHVVVGTSVIKDQGLIVVLTAKLLK